jgi:arsenate reductase
MIKIFEFKTCSTCQKALKYLDARGIAYHKFPIVENPPSEKELQSMLKHLKHDGLSFKNLFNTSGVQYRELGISEKIKAGLTEADAIKLLSQNGKLIKRPFVLTGDGGTVGFKEEKFAKLLK